MKKESFAVEGMTCSSCAQTVEKTVQKLSGVKDASVNFATEKLTVSYNEDELDVQNISEAVHQAGYEVIQPTQELTFAVEGMTCSSCAQTVEKTAKHLAGVSEAAVNLATEKMVVRFNPGNIQARDIIGAVKDAGYDAKVFT